MQDIFLLPDYFHPAWLAPQPKWNARLPCFFSLAQEPLEEILRHPHALFLEIGERRRLDETVEHILAAAPDFALSLTTASAWRSDIAHIAAGCLNRHFGLQDAKALQITTCLQEAISNAIIHGNLRLSSAFTSLEEMQLHYDRIEERIGKALYRDTRVDILAWDRNDALELAVGDSGDGFTLPTNTDERLPHGRGLMLVMSLTSRVWTGRNGRGLHMAFAYQE